MAGADETIIQVLREEAYAGSTEAARQLAAYAARYLHQDAAPMPDGLRQYLLAGFTRIARGEPADKALNLRRKRGRPSDSWTLAVAVYLSGKPLHKEPGGAYFDVGHERGRSPSDLEAAFEKHRQALMSFGGVNTEDAHRSRRKNRPIF